MRICLDLGAQGQTADAATRLEFVILDELGCPSIRHERGPAAVPPGRQACERTSVVATTNLAFGGVWPTVFVDAKMTIAPRPAGAPLRDHQDRQRKLAARKQIIDRPAGRKTAWPLVRTEPWTVALKYGRR